MLEYICKKVGARPKKHGILKITQLKKTVFLQTAMFGVLMFVFHIGPMFKAGFPFTLEHYTPSLLKNTQKKHTHTHPTKQWQWFRDDSGMKLWLDSNVPTKTCAQSQHLSIATRSPTESIPSSIKTSSSWRWCPTYRYRIWIHQIWWHTATNVAVPPPSCWQNISKYISYIHPQMKHGLVDIN